MATINTERLLTTFLELVQIDSPSGHEADVAAYCTSALIKAGCVVTSQASEPVPGSNTSNVCATLAAFPGETVPGEAPAGVSGEAVSGEASADAPKPLYFSAHMDSVEPCHDIKPRIEDGVLYSDGTTILGGDDKVGIAAILEMIRCLAEGASAGEPHPEVRVLFSVQEEVGLMGAKAMGREAFQEVQDAFCYVLDAAGSPGLVVNGAPYQRTYQAVFKGLAAHAGIAPEAGISAIRAAARAVAALPQGKLDEQSTTNVGVIKGGTVNNVVAVECFVTGELRSHDKNRLLALQAEIENILKTSATDDGTGSGAAEVTVDWEKNYEGFFISEDAPAVQLAERAARSLGLETRTEISNGGADTNVLASYGLAAVSLGSGMDHVHSVEERLAIADLENLARLALQIVEESQRGGETDAAN